MSALKHVVCGRCDSVIRVPSERLDQSPLCPRCHAALFDGHPVELSAASFDKHLSRSELPLVVDFWAPWCGPCRTMAPHFAAVAQRMEPHARFAKVNSDEAGDIAGRYGIRSIPTLIVFKDGKEVARQSGAVDSATLARWVGSAIQ